MFYLILKGKVSVWIPQAHDMMKQPLERFKRNLRLTIESEYGTGKKKRKSRGASMNEDSI